MNSKKTILVVDDEPDICEILCDFLGTLGFDSRHANGGTQALNLFAQNHFDLVISDFQMPDGSGLELLDSIKKTHPEIPFIFVMGGTDDTTLEFTYSRGAEGLLGKPFQMQALKETVQRALRPKPDRWTRKHDRSECELKVELRFPYLKHALELKVLNIGQGGMFLALDKERLPMINAVVEFRLEFSEGEISAIQGKGIVRWARDRAAPGKPMGIGIEFLDLYDESIQSLLEFINCTRPAAFIPSS